MNALSRFFCLFTFFLTTSFLFAIEVQTLEQSGTSLTVLSQTPEVLVYANNSLLGKTPLIQKTISSGFASFTFVKQGFDSESITLFIEENTKTEILVSLVQAEGTEEKKDSPQIIKKKSNPDGEAEALKPNRQGIDKNIETENSSGNVQNIKLLCAASLDSLYIIPSFILNFKATDKVILDGSFSAFIPRSITPEKQNSADAFLGFSTAGSYQISKRTIPLSIFASYSLTTQTQNSNKITNNSISGSSIGLKTGIAKHSTKLDLSSEIFCFIKNTLPSANCINKTGLNFEHSFYTFTCSLFGILKSGLIGTNAFDAFIFDAGFDFYWNIPKTNTIIGTKQYGAALFTPKIEFTHGVYFGVCF